MLADRVAEAEPQSGFDLYIYSMYEKPGWRGRTAGDQIRVPHPGTAVSYGDVLYEVVTIGPAPGTPFVYRYALRKWDDHFVVRKVFPYSMETEAAAAAEIRQRVARQRQHQWLIYLFPLTGLLPTPLLKQWKREWGLPMRGASFASIVCVGIPALLMLSYEMFGKPGASSTRRMSVLMFIALEQIVRFFWWLYSSDPVGSLTITVLWTLAAVLTGKDPEGGGE